MNSELLKIGRWLCVALGVTLVAFSLLLYQNEEGEVTNRLKAAWEALSDVARKPSQARRVHGGSSRSGRTPVRPLFGVKLFSVWSIGVSTCFSPSVAIVCSPGLSDMLDNLPVSV